ncbi:MAG: nucleoside deaminase [Deltaproteobacteria bacterium]|nr:nucleoside deaminase [Deltaproteobacteria bacterium]MBW2020178.1 nucleoside deaminase [Deltaproteobacteria bacterium]MBW2075690.1 nucleoside deaminase [Deltaproteobacteria bacterium]RLB81764.1 MAG: nucleoside deaminase [Deltaproteobacteria bacterium]
MDYDFFMLKALEEARRALSMGEFPVGCVMVYENRVLVTGARHHSAPDDQNELDHAEILALRRLVGLGEKIDREKVTLFSTLEPCLMCYAATIINGIRQIVYAYEDVMGGGTNLDLKRLNPFYRDMEITVIPDVLRDESLMLFKKFFSDPHNGYLRESLLAQYTLTQ